MKGKNLSNILYDFLFEKFIYIPASPWSGQRVNLFFILFIIVLPVITPVLLGFYYNETPFDSATVAEILNETNSNSNIEIQPPKEKNSLIPVNKFKDVGFLFFFGSILCFFCFK